MIFGDTRQRHCCFSNGKVLLISILGTCNQECLHCMRDAQHTEEGYFDVCSFENNFTNALKTINPSKIIISGGEPTLLHNLEDIIKVAKKYINHITVCTNATLIDDDVSKNMSNAGVTGVTIGIEGVNEVYNSFRKMRNGFNKVISGIMSLNKANIPITINITLWNETIGQTEEIIDFLSKFNIYAVSVTTPILQGRAKNNDKLFSEINYNSLQKFIDALSSSNPKYLLQIRTPFCDSNTCPSGSEIFTLYPDGVVAGCPDIGSKNILK